MMPIFLASIAIIVLIALWAISTQRKLVVLDENISNAMSQIGVQLSSRFDSLTALLDLAKSYTKHESETLIKTIKSRRIVITAKSTPEDVLRQEGIISEALCRIAMLSEHYPELKANETYITTMDAMQTFENMVRTSRLVYNDSVTKLNREIRMFPSAIIAGVLGFRQRNYLENQTSTNTANINAFNNTSSSGMDAIEEIKKYKTLMEDEIISSKEFDAKKKQLLRI